MVNPIRCSLLLFHSFVSTMTFFATFWLYFSFRHCSQFRFNDESNWWYFVRIHIFHVLERFRSPALPFPCSVAIFYSFCFYSNFSNTYFLSINWWIQNTEYNEFKIEIDGFHDAFSFDWMVFVFCVFFVKLYIVHCSVRIRIFLANENISISLNCGLRTVWV